MYVFIYNLCNLCIQSFFFFLQSYFILGMVLPVIKIQGDSKLLSGLPFIGDWNRDDNLESLCADANLCKCVYFTFHFSTIAFIFSLLSLFWKNKRSFMRSPCCLSVLLWTPLPVHLFVYVPIFLDDLNHLTACVSACPTLAFSVSVRSLLCQGDLRDHLLVCAFLCPPSSFFVFNEVRVSKKSRRLVLPKTSCCLSNYYYYYYYFIIT
jgi:hypothetical protein